MAMEKRGSIGFFTVYRPPVPLDLFSCPLKPTSKQDELHLTDGVSYNYNGKLIPSEFLKKILKRPKLASEAKEADVDSGRLSGFVFVSERDHLETLHIALRFNDDPVVPSVKVFNISDVFDTFNGVRLEDSGSVAGDYLVYVSTKDPAPRRRQPWTAVYKTHLETGETHRLTPPAEADLSPSVSPSGKKIAVASFQQKGGWNGEVEDLHTDIFVMNLHDGGDRRLVVRSGGWPTWGSDDVLFFHRKVGEFWGVFRADLRNGVTSRVTPDDIDARTPAAIDATTVAVATIRKPSKLAAGALRVEEAQYRHIEIFDSAGEQPSNIRITHKIRPKADHFNPFVIDGGKRIGYHRGASELVKSGDEIVEKHFHKLDCPQPGVGLFRVSGAFPTFSADGSKLAFVDNDFKTLWIADSQGLRPVFEASGPDGIFSPVWSQDPEKDILYVCLGPSFHAEQVVNICAIHGVASGEKISKKLTNGFNNAFPSTNPDGTKLVYRSTRDGYKNLYIMEDALAGEDGKITRLTNGAWNDTHCEWSPSGEWIVFSSTRDKPENAPDTTTNVDPGYFVVYLVKWDKPEVLVRVMGSGNDLAGFVNHPFFSPDGKSIVVTSDLAGVSADPTGLPLFLHSSRPYGDIFTFDIDPDDIYKNENVKKFNRLTHSRYENSTGTWTLFSTQDPHAAWNLLLNESEAYPLSCPYASSEHVDGGENWHMNISHPCNPKPKRS